ncbi:MAG: DUF4280 domain-containing protein [Lachnospiraceae bacterium]
MGDTNELQEPNVHYLTSVQHENTLRMNETGYTEAVAQALWEEKTENAKNVAEAEARAAIEEEKALAREAAANQEVAFIVPYDYPAFVADEESETEKKIQEAQDEMIAALEALQEEHLVRGAMMHCQYGSHYRRLNLPRSHGEEENSRPLMTAADYSAGEDGNIPYFGVCSCSNNKTEGSILLKGDYQRDILGRKISDEPGKNVRGTPCRPQIATEWLNPHEGTKINGIPTITPASFLVCEYGGIIEVTDSGQNDDETKVR